jgi:hypothetical protein
MAGFQHTDLPPFFDLNCYYAIENYSEMFLHIEDGKINIRIHRDITGEMWFGAGELFLFHFELFWNLR